MALTWAARGFDGKSDGIFFDENFKTAFSVILTGFAYLASH